MIRRAPAHLVLKGSVYHFRLAIPSDLRRRLGRAEFHVSLRTGYLPLARPRATRLSAVSHDIFQALRKGDTPLAKLNDDYIRALADQWLREALDMEYEYLLRPDTPQEARDPEHRALAMSDGQDRAVEDLLSKNFSRISSRVDTVLQEAGVTVEQDSPEYRKLCDAFLRSEAQFYTHAAKPFFQGSAELSGAEGHQTPGDQSRPQTAKPVPLLSEAVEKYIKIKTDAGNWGKSSLKTTPPILREFVELAEYHAGAECDVQAVDRDLIRAYGDMVQRLPGARNKAPKYRSKSLTALLKATIDNEDLPSPKTTKNKFTVVRSFLTWAEDEDYVPNAGALKRAIADPKQAVRAGQSTRAPFSTQDLTLLFGSEAYRKDDHRSAYQHWLPLLGLFTGSRIEELCQIHLDDIRQIDGVWCLDINDQGEKRVKTQAGKRIVPLHPFLMEAGLLERVEHLRSKHHVRLFPKLKLRPSTGKYSDAASSWFTRYRRDLGIGKDESGRSKVFHSFRHTFVTACKHLGVDRRMVKELVGHEDGQAEDVTEIYEGGYPVAALLKDGVARLDFAKTVDMAHVKGSKWVKQP